MSPRRLPSFRPILATLLLVALVACGGDDDPTGPGLGSAGLTAKVDGATWTAAAAFAISSGGFVSVGASNVSGEAIGFALQGSTTGTYPISVSVPTTASLTIGSDVWSAGPSTGSGAVVITALDATHVAGSFTFSVVSMTGSPATRSITEGAFDIDF